ncbi:S41 family peptidase [soil metagenome]
MNLLPSRRALLAGGLTAAALGSSRAWADTGPEIASAALIEDADLFRRAYFALHPGLLRYSSEAAMAANFADLRAFCARPRPLAQAHLAFARTVAKVRCGHSYLNPYNQTGPALSLIEDGRTRLPFRFRWLGDRMVVAEGGAGADAPPRGTEILAIGGVPVGRILATLAPYACADGHNDAKRVRLMEVRGESLWELFDVYFPLLFPSLVADGAATLTLRLPGGEVRRRRVALLTRQQRAVGVRAGAEPKGAVRPAWAVERLADGVAWLTMPTWALYDSPWDWTTALNAMMDDLIADRAPGLILDLRGNGGGLDVGDVILSRLVDRTVLKADAPRFVRYRKTPADLDPYLKTWDSSFRDWGDKAVEPPINGLYRLTRYDDTPEGDVIAPVGRRFTGRVAVIIDASNSSATFGFADTLKQHGLATLIGQTTGGNRRGINGGAFFFLRLPGSGLEIDVPLIGYFPTAPQPDAGVEPDIPVPVSIEDIVRGVDRERLVALRQVTGRA